MCTQIIEESYRNRMTRYKIHIKYTEIIYKHIEKSYTNIKKSTKNMNSSFFFTITSSTMDEGRKLVEENIMIGGDQETLQALHQLEKLKARLIERRGATAKTRDEEQLSAAARTRNAPGFDESYYVSEDDSSSDS